MAGSRKAEEFFPHKDDFIESAGDLIAEEYAAETSRTVLGNLERTLDGSGVDRGRYCFGNRRPNKMALVYENGRWVITYSERGNDDPVGEYGSLKDACSKMIDLMIPYRLRNRLAKARFRRLMLEDGGEISPRRLREMAVASISKAASL